MIDGFSFKSMSIGMIYPSVVVMRWRPLTCMDLSSTLFVRLHLWDRVNCTAFSAVGVVVVDGHDFTTMSLDNIGTGDKLDACSTVFIVALNINHMIGIIDDDHKVASSDAPIGSTVDHIDAGFHTR